MNDIFIRILALPLSVRAFTLPDAQGDYNIYVNCALSAEQQKRSVQHEATHIRRGDFYKNLPAAAIEQEMMQETKR